MRIAVTGGSGFIGQAVLREADRQGHDAWAFDRSEGNDVLGDLSDLKSAGTVIHLAGVLGTSELLNSAEEAVNVNVIGSLRIMEWCVQNEAKYIGILMPDLFPSVYTATKIASKRLCDALVNGSGLQAAHVRAFNAYGPGQKHGPGHPQKILPTFAHNAWRGLDIPIWGDGDQVVDMIHADDLGRLLVWAAEELQGNEVIDGGTGTAISVNQLAQFTLFVTGSKSKVVHLPMRPGEKPTRFCYASKEGWESFGNDMRMWPRFSWDRIAEAIHAYK